MRNQALKRRLIIGAVIFAFLVFAGGVGMWLFSRTTDNRSQASADHVAQIKILSQKDQTGQLAHNVAVDISQMKAGTTVTDFTAQVFLPIKRFSPPEETPMPKPSMQPYPTAIKVTGPAPRPSYQPMPRELEMVSPTPVAVQVLGVSTEEQLAALPPGATAAPVVPSRSVTKEPFPTAVTQTPPQPSALLARSGDGFVRVMGVGQFGRLKNLTVKITTSDKGYLIDFSAQAAAKDDVIQKAFIGVQPFLTILVTEKAGVVLSPEVQMASIRGYLPGLQTVVELTKPVVSMPTVTPEKPPVVVKTCRVTADCPKGYTCQQPAVQNCPPGKICTLPVSWQCVLAPTKVPSRTPTRVVPTKVLPTKTPPQNVTERPRVIIRSVQ